MRHSDDERWIFAYYYYKKNYDAALKFKQKIQFTDAILCY